MKVGINAMSVIKPMCEDFEETVRYLREGGCDFIEAMSNWGAKEETIAFYESFTGKSGWDRDNTVKRQKYLRAAGMGIKGMFVFTDLLENQAEEMGQYCQENSISYVVVSYLNYDGLDDIYSKISSIQRISRILSKYGIKIYMHNHECDLEVVEDRDGLKKRIIDIFMENLKPCELMLEVDVGWLTYAGISPSEFLKKYIGRTSILHLKDICRNYQNVDRDEIFVACGKGIVDFEAIFGIVKRNGREDILNIIDQDNSKGNILSDLVEGVRYLKKLP